VSFERLLCCLLVVVVCNLSCSITKDVGVAERAAENFYQEMAAGHYVNIYNTGGDSFKAGIKQKDFVDFCERVNRKMGACASMTLAAQHILATPQGTIVNLTYKMKCVNGELIEQLQWRILGGRVTLSRFTVNSPQLLDDSYQTSNGEGSHFDGTFRRLRGCIKICVNVLCI
jgi:hypothetical protein